jgi:hypothetical protein
MCNQLVSNNSPIVISTYDENATAEEKPVIIKEVVKNIYRAAYKVKYPFRFQFISHLVPEEESLCFVTEIDAIRSGKPLSVCEQNRSFKTFFT